MRPIEVSNARLAGLREKLIDEARQLLLIFVYLWALFSLFAFHKSMLLAGHSTLYNQGIAFVNALVFAKVMFFGERFHLGEIFQDKPLIWPVLVKAALFTVVMIAFHVVEEVVVGFTRGKTIVESIPGFGEQNALGIGAVAVIMFVVLIPFFAFREIGRILGQGELLRLFLTKSANQSRWRSSGSRGPEPDMARN